MVEATRTVRIPLIIPDDRRDDLHQTHLKYQHCQNQTVEYCWPIKPKQPDDLITDKGEAEAVLYDQLREDTDGLRLTLVCNEIVRLFRLDRPAVFDGLVLTVLVF